jgi:hypothetical protein
MCASISVSDLIGIYPVLLQTLSGTSVCSSATSMMPSMHAGDASLQHDRSECAALHCKQSLVFCYCFNSPSCYQKQLITLLCPPCSLVCCKVVFTTDDPHCCNASSCVRKCTTPDMQCTPEYDGWDVTECWTHGVSCFQNNHLQTSVRSSSRCWPVYSALTSTTDSDTERKVAVRPFEAANEL